MNAIEQSILNRKSVRKYLSDPISEEELTRINSILKETIKTPFGSQAHFTLINKKIAGEQAKLKLGTYGFITGAQYFIVGAVTKSEMACVDYGYSLERIILKLTNLGFGTCWLGGTFRKGEFAKSILLEENEIIPAITPVGIEVKSMKNAIIRSAIKANKRKPFETLFYLNNDAHSNIYLKALEMVRLSPSADNFQPWRVITESNKFHFFIKRNKALSNFKDVDLQKVDLGIAMCHFEMFLEENGIKASWARESKAESLNDELCYIATFQ